ncbi:unnamed protein product, partial [Polarella glacialis]
VDPVVRGVLGDLSGCVMCYGQTSAGKTHTMEGYEDDLRGLIPRALETVFSNPSAVGEEPAVFHISMMEIYMERLRDLLDPEGEAELVLAEDKHQGVVVRGLREAPATTLQQAIGIWLHGRQHRATAATGMNENSSRSHCIFMIRAERPVGGDRFGFHSSSS